MQKQLNAVKLFHETYGLGVSEEMKADLGALKNELRFNLMKEENEEYLEAVQNNDIVEIADACADLKWVVEGLEHTLEIPQQEVWNEVARSNLAKISSNGKVAVAFKNNLPVTSTISSVSINTLSYLYKIGFAASNICSALRYLKPPNLLKLPLGHFNSA